MEKSQSEVTNKIRSAIKKKISEISEFVDDELPEYIMILVANQRSKSQIMKDLSLFLRDDTEKFTDWLWDLLNNLKVGYKSSEATNSKNEPNPSKTKEIDDEDAVVLECDPDEDERDFLSHDDTSDSSASKTSAPQTLTKPVEETNKDVPTLKSSGTEATEKNKSPSNLLETPHKPLESNISKEALLSAVIPVKKPLSINSEDEYDPAKPEYVCSPCSTAKRKYGGSSALQANKLLLKAVDDATKSILDGKSIEDFYKPTPIKVLTSKRYRNPVSRKKDINLTKKNVSNYDISEPETDAVEISQYSDQEVSGDIFDNESYFDDSASSHKNRTICLRTIPLISNSPQKDEDSPFYTISPEEEVRSKSPHFIVTLEGVSPASFKRKHEDSSNESSHEDEADETLLNEVEADDTAPEKKLKIIERCKYWPACKNSDKCSYHHPTIPCKCFPDCKFGEKCLYIHPNCKFDALCSRKDCPYTHASKRKLPLTALPVRMTPLKTHKVKPVCKFFPKCVSNNCPFVHPKLCRYGTECRIPTCIFGHFAIPSRSQMKWQADIS